LTNRQKQQQKTSKNIYEKWRKTAGPQQSEAGQGLQKKETNE